MQASLLLKVHPLVKIGYHAVKTSKVNLNVSNSKSQEPASSSHQYSPCLSNSSIIEQCNETCIKYYSPFA